MARRGNKEMVVIAACAESAAVIGTTLTGVHRIGCGTVGVSGSMVLDSVLFWKLNSPILLFSAVQEHNRL